MGKKCKRCSSASVGAINLDGININRGLGIGAGAVAAKMVNVPLNRYLSRWVSDNPETGKNEGKWARMAVAGGKLVGGLYLSSTSGSELLQDAGLGFVAVGALELMEELAPNINLNGLDTHESLGSSASDMYLNLQELAGAGSEYNRTQAKNEVAGSKGSLMPRHMELAGMEMY